MRALSLVALVMIGTAAPAAAQLAARQEPQEKILVLPFQAAAADSAASIQLADAVRARLTSATKGKLMVVPKEKLCEALRASGFPCDGLLDDQQGRQLARFLQVNAYVTGTFEKQGTQLVAHVRVADMGAGMPGSFTATNGNPGTAAALADAIALRLTALARASEFVRDCDNERRKGQFQRARAAAQKAMTADPNSTGAHLCLATLSEAQRMPVDSMIEESKRALTNDSTNATALENIARGYQQKGDTTAMVEAFRLQLRGSEARNTAKRLGLAQLLRQMKKYDESVDLLNEGLALIPGDQQMLELKLTICTEASNFPCANEVWKEKFARDTALGADTTFLKPAIGAAQHEQVKDTVALLAYTQAAVRHFPSNPTYIRARAAAFELAAKPDSALGYYRRALQLDPNDVGTSLQVAKAIIDRAQYDTSRARVAREAKDSVGLRNMQAQYAARVDSAKPFLRPGLSSTDSTQRLAAAVIMLTGASKLAQAAAYDDAYAWSDTLLQIVAPRATRDTTGPWFQIRVNGSFWYGLSSTLTMGKAYAVIPTLKASDRQRCDKARAVFDRLTHTRQALQLGRRVHPPTADQMLGFVAQYERARPQVQAAFKCRPPLS